MRRRLKTVKEILTAAGFTDGETFRETRFLSPPCVTYAVYLDSFSRLGGDLVPLAKDHSITIELYEYAPDKDAEERIEAVLDQYLPAMAGAWDKQDRYWIQEDQLYQVVYTFNYIEKKRS